MITFLFSSLVQAAKTTMRHTLFVKPSHSTCGACGERHNRTWSDFVPQCAHCRVTWFFITLHSPGSQMSEEERRERCHALAPQLECITGETVASVEPYPGYLEDRIAVSAG